MLTRWSTGFSDFDNLFTSMNQLRRYMDRVFEDYRTPEGAAWPQARAVWPRINLSDTGTALVVTAEVPGLSEKDVQLTLNQDVLSLRGERKVDAPEGYSVHRQERPIGNFARSFSLPCKVNPEKASATVKNGILTITLEKAVEAQPRQITIKAQ